ncbi:MAG: D-alanyl-D-alanine carboxypeptidase [Gammaproteobacteria bacterium]|nr:D-alanyl-D-alanine carboxypeptidase [Gammaproteobacteria bacterium]
MRQLIASALLAGAVGATSTFAATGVIPEPPPIASKSHILMDAETLTVMSEHDADAPLPPASLTKIMTSYVAASELASGRIATDDDVPISVKAWRTGGSKMFVREGTTVKLIDLLRGIVIQSGNDASVAVAEYIGGGEDAFADMMNHEARALGMPSTRFVNSTGLPDDGHHSSARDMAKLSAALIKRFPDHYRLYAEKSFQYGEIERPQYNRNKLLWRDKSVDGVKTGLTEAAGYCLVASALRDGTRLIAVVMGAESDEQRNRDAQKLLAYGFRYFQTRELFGADALVASPQVWYGTVDSVDVTLREPVRVTVPRGNAGNVEAVVDLPQDLEAPIATGDIVGTLRVALEGEVLLERPLVARTEVPEAGFFEKLWDGIRLMFKNLFSDDSPDAQQPVG